MRRLFVISILMLGLSACGFQPLYGNVGGTSVTNDLRFIDIAPLGDRLGQMVNNHLLDGMQPQGPAGEARYELVVTLTEERIGFGFRQDESITRERYTLSAQYQLINLADSSILTEACEAGPTVQ